MNRRAAVLLCAALVMVALTACGQSYPVRETVLTPGQTIEAKNKFGWVRISYVDPLRRKYVWDGGSRVVKLQPRPERFLGELGIYDPADCFLGCRFPRLVLEEARHDFDSYDEVYAKLYEGSAIMDWVYTSDGLVVGFGRFPQRQQIDIEVRQITIHGQKPVGLKGARDGDVRLIQTR